MTAHIDTENLETEVQECDPHNVHDLQRALQRVNHSKRGYMFLLGVSVFFNLVFIFGRIIE